jgi:energy-coupling factor transporter ATP-binding protein EcfA2
LIDKVLRELAAIGIAIILVEYDMELVMGVSSHVIVLDAGAKIAEGAPHEIAASPAVREAYLGAGVRTHLEVDPGVKQAFAQFVQRRAASEDEIVAKLDLREEQPMLAAGLLSLPRRKERREARQPFLAAA